MSKLLKEFTVYQKPLSVNQLYCITRTGKKYLNPKHKKFKEEMQINSNNEMFDCKMRIEIEYYIDRVNTSDWDNPNKALNDSLEATGIIKNDALIFKADVEKFHAKRKDIKTIIRLYEY